MKIFVNFVCMLNMFAHMERTREIEIDVDETNDEIAPSLVQAEIAFRLGLELRQTQVINIYEIYKDPPLNPEPQGLQGKLSLKQLQANEPDKKFSVKIPIETYDRLDTLLDTPPKPREHKKKLTKVYLTFVWRLPGSGNKVIEEQFPFEFENEEEKEEITEEELQGLLAKKFNAPPENFHVILNQPGMLAKFLGGEDKKFKIKDHINPEVAKKNRVPIIIRNENLWLQINSVLLRPARQQEVTAKLLEDLDRRPWVQKLGLPKPVDENVERNAGMASKAPVPPSPKPARYIADRSKEVFAKSLKKLRVKLDGCQPPLFPYKVSQAAENIYQQVNRKINNNVNFALLNEGEVKDYFRLVSLVEEVLNEFPKACKAATVPTLEGEDYSGTIPVSDKFDRKFVELKSIAKRIEGARSFGKIIAGAIIAFIAAVSLAVLATLTIMSAGFLTVPNFLPAYLSLTMFSIGANLAASGLGLTVVGGMGVATAVSGHKRGIAKAVDDFVGIVREERRSYRDTHAEAMQHQSKLQ